MSEPMDVARRALRALSRDGLRAQRSPARELLIRIGLADEDEPEAAREATPTRDVPRTTANKAEADIQGFVETIEKRDEDDDEDD